MKQYRHVTFKLWNKYALPPSPHRMSVVAEHILIIQYKIEFYFQKV